MEKITCIALDDEPLPLQLLEMFIRQTEVLEPLGFFTNPFDAQQHLQTKHIDLLFLDIQMPDINGLDFLKEIPKSPMVVFTTAFREFAVEGFELKALDYLVKPFDYQRFHQAIERAIEYKQLKKQRQNDFILIKSNYNLLKIYIDDLRYIEAYGDYLKIYLSSSERPVLTLLSLKEIEKLLPTNAFIRVHRSFIVALNKIKSIRKNYLYLGKEKIPIGATYQAGVLSSWK
jgi:two-component system, LytTR family, response regulator